jgi:M6 family metalloprotease-like protein
VTSTRHRSVRRIQVGGVAGSAVLSAGLLVTLGPVPAAAEDPSADGASPVAPVDEQVWTEQAEMTWADYQQIRPKAWNSAKTSRGSEVQYKTAVILVDFQDQPFLITEEAESHPFGNPQSGWEPVPQAGVDEWFNDYYAVPNQYNGGQTLHSYWMEDSHGRIGVDVEVFGPYRMPGKLHEYGLEGFAPVTGPNSVCPEGDDCDKDIRDDAAALWRADIGCSAGLCGFDNGFFVSAGHDESSTWQEFGPMLFLNREDVPAEFGPPGATEGPVFNEAGNPIPNWSPTRYVPWTSWAAAANHWPNAGGGTSTQAESSGQSVFAHEFSHLRSLPDNYNNPFADTDRNYTGYWEMMSRGTFNGPGGTHNRWQIPNAGGSALGSHHMLHFKTTGPQRLGVVRDSEQVILERNDLPSQGIAVTRLKAREYIPNGDKVGLTVNLGAGGYTPGACQTRTSDPFWCTHTNETTWQRFTMEVVDRVGNDSFVAGHGVLLAQARDFQQGQPSNPRVQLIDANIEDIDRIDFYRPNGDPVPVVRGDPRQLDDATFHAGTNSGSEYEYVDAPNRLHFYVLDVHRDKRGVLYYDVAVRNLDGAGDFERDVAIRATSTRPIGGGTTLIRTLLSNTGTAGTGLFGSDVYRLSATVDGAGWSVHLPYEVRAVKAGAELTTPVYATAGDDASDTATVTITATSEADPSATATIEVPLAR